MSISRLYPERKSVTAPRAQRSWWNSTFELALSRLPSHFCSGDSLGEDAINQCKGGWRSRPRVDAQLCGNNERQRNTGAPDSIALSKAHETESCSNPCPTFRASTSLSSQPALPVSFAPAELGSCLPHVSPLWFSWPWAKSCSPFKASLWGGWRDDYHPEAGAASSSVCTSHPTPLPGHLL